MRPNTIAVAFIVALLTGCAELKDELPPPTDGGADVHPEGWADPASASFHGDFIRDDAWDMRECQTCHGSDYSGGTVNVSCRTCHTNSGGPENCATCHGSVNPAPPRDISENTSSDLPGVGAHQVHMLGGNDVSHLTVPCGQCHTVPAGTYVPGHVDSDLPAEVAIEGGMAQIDPTVNTGSPHYDFQANTCDNVYCHGNWLLNKTDSPNQWGYSGEIMFGNNFSPVWTGGGAEIECGTCHGLPPQGHISADLDACGGCHSNIVSPDGTIADKARHINGRINILGTERPF